MASTIVTKNSSTASAVPLTGDLTQGELAVNVTDKRLFTKNSGGTVVELGTNPASLALPNGTANGVAYLNGSKVLTTGSALTFDGTTFKAAKAGTPYIYAENTANAQAAAFVAKNTAGSSYLGQDSTGGYIGTDYAAPFLFYINNTEQMRLTSTGLGIGTSSPTQKLSVAAAAALMDITSTTGTNFNGLELKNTSGSFYIGEDNSAGSFYGSNSAYARSLYATGAYPMVFFTNATERMRLDSSGNLGLGVTPSSWSSGGKLQVGAGQTIGSIGNGLVLASNWYYNAGDKFAGTGYATYYNQSSGIHSWVTSTASGTAGAAATLTQAMTLDASGNLGVGTTSMGSFKLKVQGTGGNLSGNAYFVGLIGEGAASNKGVGLGYDSSSQTGIIYSETASAASNLAFWTYSGSAWGERARIDSSGNLLVKTTTQQFSATCTVLQATAGNAVYAAHNSATSGDNNFIWFGTEAGGTTRGTITYNRVAGLVAYNTTSDYRAKTVKGPVQNALEKVVALKPSTGRMNDAEQDIDFFVAHELQEVVPSAVTGEKDAVNEDGTPKYQMVDKSALIPLLTAAIQEQQALITQLTERITALEGK